MKAIFIATFTLATQAAFMSTLENLRNHNQLKTDSIISPLESIAHIATFDEVPVFGGHELREQMLQQPIENKESALSLFASNLIDTVENAAKTVSCNAQVLAHDLAKTADKDFKLQYSSYCEELPSKSLRESPVETDQLLQ